MSIKAKGKLGKTVPSVGRKWAGDRWTVVLKVPKWEQGVMLFSETPLAVCCGFERPMAQVPQEPEPDDHDDDQNATPADNKDSKRESKSKPQPATDSKDAGAAESARVKRWLDARKRGWKPEEILMYEVLLYCKDHQAGSSARRRKAKKPVVGPEWLPSPPPDSVAQNLDGFLRHAEWLFQNRAYEYRLKAQTEDQAARRAEMVRILAETSFINDTMFSRREKGLGWYPLLGHVRQAPVGSNEVNACVWFQNSVAHLIPLVPLAAGTEVVIAANRDQIAALQPLKAPTRSEDLPAALEPSVYETIMNQAGIDGAIVNRAWQQVARLAAEFGQPALRALHRHHIRAITTTSTASTSGPALSSAVASDAHPPSASGLKTTPDEGQEPTGFVEFLKMMEDLALTFMRVQWVDIEHNQRFGIVPDMVRIEFLLIYIQEIVRILSPPKPAPSSSVAQDTTKDPRVEASAKGDAELAQDSKTAPDPTLTSVKSASVSDKGAPKPDANGKKDGKDGTKGKEKSTDMPELVDFLEQMGIKADEAPAVKEADGQLTQAEWSLYGQLTVIANRRVLLYDLLPLLHNDPAALAYHQVWHSPQVFIPGNQPPAVSLIDRWNTIATKLGKHHPNFFDKE